MARELALTVNQAGACLIGSSLAEGTGSLNNLAVRAANMGKEVNEAYPEIILELTERLADFCLTATANRPGDIFRVSGIREQAAEFEASIKSCLCFQQK